MSEIKLIFSDVDHTLIMTRDGGFPKQVAAAVEKLKEKGVGFTFASGRLPYMLSPYLQEMSLDVPVVACSGGLVYHGEKIIFEKSFQVSSLHGLIEYADSLDMTVLYSVRGEEYCLRETEGARKKKEQRGNYHPLRSISADEWKSLNTEKFIIMDDTGKGRIPLLKSEEEKVAADLAFTHYSDAAVEITPGGVNKATGIAEVCKYLSIGIENVMAIGDNENDFEMVKSAGVGVAVSNAKPELKKLADFVSEKIGPDGVVDAIERFVLSK